MITHHGEVKLIDFGIARAARRVHETVAGAVKGAIGYMSPEQVNSASLDHRSDIFVAGTLLFELLIGINPFRSEGKADTLRRVNEVIIEPSSWSGLIPADLARVCARALQRLPADRFQSAGEMQEELDHHCHEHRYGSRQLAGWMASNCPELERAMAEFETARRYTMADFPPGGTRAESTEIDLPPGGTRSQSDADVLSPADAFAVAEHESEADSGEHIAYAETVLADEGPEPGTERETVSMRGPLPEFEGPRLVDVHHAETELKVDPVASTAVAERETPTEVEARDVSSQHATTRRKTTDASRQRRDPAWRSKLLKTYLGLAVAFLGVAALIVWVIGFGGVTLATKPAEVVADPARSSDTGPARPDHGLTRAVRAPGFDAAAPHGSRGRSGAAAPDVDPAPTRIQPQRPIIRRREFIRRQGKILKARRRPRTKTTKSNKKTKTTEPPPAKKQEPLGDEGAEW
jgi:hypothetical protein